MDRASRSWRTEYAREKAAARELNDVQFEVMDTPLNHRTLFA